jgi:5'-phosphate synthase pdxT subunit
MVEMRKVRIGVLALQGAFQLHRRHLEALHVEYVEVVRPLDFRDIDGLIVPGGESGVMLRLIDLAEIAGELRHCAAKIPIWGICAGAILLAREVCKPSQRSLAAIDILVERNSYGRHAESNETLVRGYRVSFIRAPRILAVGSGVTVKESRHGDPVWLESAKIMVTTFHPELNMCVPSPWHERFLELCNLPAKP